MLSLIIILGCVVFFLLRRKKNESLLPPVYPNALPIIGHAHHVIGNRIQIWESLKRIIDFSLKQDGVAYMYTGNYKVYFVSDPEDCMVVFNVCLYKPYIFNFMKQWLGESLITTEPPMWKPISKAMRPILTQRHVNENITAFNNHSRQLVKTLEGTVGKGLIDTRSYFSVHALRLILESAFGLKNGNSPSTNQTFCTEIDVLMNLLYKRVLNPFIHLSFTYYFTSLKKQIDEVVTKITDITKKNIENRKTELKKLRSIDSNVNNEHTQVFYDSLSKLNGKEYFSDEDMENHMNTLLLAGSDTSFKVLSVIMPLIGSHPEVQDHLYKELQDVVGDSERDLDKDDLNKLVYMDAVINETLRLYPPVPIIGRCSNSEVKLRNYTIPKGGMFAIAVYGMHRHPVWGSDASEFKPERWLQKERVPENAFAGFGLGPRTCIGKTYGLTSLKVTLSHILMKYRVKADISKLVFEINTFLKASSGYEIELELRTKKHEN